MVGFRHNFKKLNSGPDAIFVKKSFGINDENELTLDAQFEIKTYVLVLGVKWVSYKFHLTWWRSTHKTN